MAKAKAKPGKWDIFARAKRLGGEQHAMVCCVQESAFIGCQRLSEPHEVSEVCHEFACRGGHESTPSYRAVAVKGRLVVTLGKVALDREAAVRHSERPKHLHIDNISEGQAGSVGSDLAHHAVAVVPIAPDGAGSGGYLQDWSVESYRIDWRVSVRRRTEGTTHPEVVHVSD